MRAPAHRIEALLEDARRNLRQRRSALVIAEGAMNAAARGVADAEADYERLGDRVDSYRTLRTAYREALRKWRLAKQTLETAEARRAA